LSFGVGGQGGYGGSPPSKLARGPGGCVSPRWGMPRGEAPAEIFFDHSYKKQDFPLFLDPPYAPFSLGQINEKVGCGIYSSTTV